MDDKIIEVIQSEEIVVEMQEAIGWTGGDGTTHNDLAGREESDQHPIKAVIGLRDKLDEIKQLQTVYSDKMGLANYYKWDSGAYNDYGYFVSLASADTIKICDGTDIFGVTVDSAAFVGGQVEAVTEETDEYDMPKHLYATDNTYALVATSGQVAVRCASDVVADKYVIANEYGIAVLTDSGCGYKVSATSYKETPSGKVLFAIISLGVQACTTDVLGQRVKQLETDMDDAEINIATAMRLANEACAMAGTSNTTSDETNKKVDNIVDAVDKMQGELDSTREDLDKSKIDISNTISAADKIAKEAKTTADEALSDINNLIDTFEPIQVWVDDETGKVSAEYVVRYMDQNGLSTKAEVQTVESIAEDNKSWIKHNGENIEMAVSSVDKYSVGEYSQAYGLTLEQARNILKDGMIYIPTKHGNVETHIESYIYNETEKLEKEFTEGYYYIWSEQLDGKFMWSEKIAGVWANKEQPAGDAYKYWYDGDKLCLLNDGEWIEVATLAGNVNNRITNIIRQDVDSVTKEIVNARGSGLSLNDRLTETDAAIENIAFWKKDDGTEYVAAFRQVAGEGENEGASLSLVAYKTDSKGNDESIDLRGASFTVGFDEETDSSYIDFKAENIKLTGEQISAIADEIELDASDIILDGYVTIDSLKDGGTTEIDGSRIITGTIQSKYYTHTSGDIYSNSGTAINLTTGDIISEKFRLDSTTGTVYAKNGDFTGIVHAEDGVFNGVVYAKDGEFAGTIHAEDGDIGGWNINSQGIHNNLVGMYSDDDFLMSNSNSPVRFHASEAVNHEIGVNVVVDEEGELTMELNEYYYTYKNITFKNDSSLSKGQIYIIIEGTPLVNASITQGINVSLIAGESVEVKDQHTLLYKIALSGSGDTINETIIINYSCLSPVFAVLNDGSMHSTRANIKGIINADSGHIGGLQIQAGVRGYKDGMLAFELASDGLHIDNSAGMLTVGNCTLSCDDKNKFSLLEAGGPFYIKGGDTSIEFMTGGNIDLTASAEFVIMTTSFEETHPIVQGRLLTTEYLIRPKRFTIYYVVGHRNELSRSEIKSHTFTIYANEMDSAPYDFTAFASNSEQIERYGPLYIKFGLTPEEARSSSNVYEMTALNEGEQTALDLGTIEQSSSDGNINFMGRLIPKREGQDIGSDSRPWDNIYVTTLHNNILYSASGAVSDSDKNKKNTINILSNDYDLVFDKLRPVTFKYNNGTSDRLHTGFIAQEVKDSVIGAGLTTKDFAGYCEWTDDNGVETCGLRYSEFIALCVDQIQKLKSRVEELEKKISDV